MGGRPEQAAASCTVAPVHMEPFSTHPAATVPHQAALGRPCGGAQQAAAPLGEVSRSAGSRGKWGQSEPLGFNAYSGARWQLYTWNLSPPTLLRADGALARRQRPTLRPAAGRACPPPPSHSRRGGAVADSTQNGRATGTVAGPSAWGGRLGRKAWGGGAGGPVACGGDSAGRALAAAAGAAALARGPRRKRGCGGGGNRAGRWGRDPAAGWADSAGTGSIRTATGRCAAVVLAAFVRVGEPHPQLHAGAAAARLRRRGPRRLHESADRVRAVHGGYYAGQ